MCESGLAWDLGVQADEEVSMLWDRLAQQCQQSKQEMQRSPQTGGLESGMGA